MRALLLAALLVPSVAHADKQPPGRMSALVGFDFKYDGGFLYGGEAAWEPLPDGRRLSYSLEWDVLFTDYFSDPAAINGSLHLVQMDATARLRLVLATGRSLFLGAGGGLLHASSPLPPRDRSSYFDDYADAGLEVFAGGGVRLTIEGRYGLFGPVPHDRSLFIGIGFGV
jgi:hypothetical protein